MANLKDKFQILCTTWSKSQSSTETVPEPTLSRDYTRKDREKNSLVDEEHLPSGKDFEERTEFHSRGEVHKQDWDLVHQRIPDLELNKKEIRLRALEVCPLQGTLSRRKHVCGDMTMRKIKGRKCQFKDPTQRKEGHNTQRQPIPKRRRNAVNKQKSIFSYQRKEMPLCERTKQHLRHTFVLI